MRDLARHRPFALPVIVTPSLLQGVIDRLELSRRIGWPAAVAARLLLRVTLILTGANVLNAAETAALLRAARRLNRLALSRLILPR